ncbi:hypothetical protein ACIO5Z_14740 [Streptomyces rochei]|uniref:hypothetical protein n=1 Tax=Streptomyces rochei TaxID=1928 RepID=UPI00381CD29A
MTDQTATDRHVAEARRDVHESLTLLPAWEADRVRSLIADLESAVESRTAVRMAEAASAVPLPPADQTAPLRDRIAETIWAQYPDAEPSRTGLVMANPHAVADAVLPVVLSAPADRAAILREAADHLDNSERLRDYTDDHMGDINEAANELRRMADETATTETGCWCGHPEDRHWTGATAMTFTDGCHDCRGWNGAHVYGQELPWLPEGDEPAAGARQDGADRG